MIYVFIGFTIIFILFISLILKYGQAFKVKNNLINYLEEFEGYNPASIENIDQFIEDSTYRPKWDSSMKVENANCSRNFGYCIRYHQKNESEGYYSVYTFVRWQFPFFGLHDTWVIKGETRPVAIGS